MTSEHFLKNCDLSKAELELSRKVNLEEVSKIFINGDVLHPLQALDTVKMLVRKCALNMYGTGTGKTYIASALIKLLRDIDSDSRVIMLVKKSQLIQTPADVEKLTGISVIATNAERKNLEKVFATGDFLKYGVLMLTHNCLSSKVLMSFLFKYKDAYLALIHF